MIRKCKDCESSWTVDEAEQQWCRAQGTAQPRRCLSCRAKRRGFTTEMVACSRCGDDFEYSGELAILVATFSWKTPTRCPDGCEPQARKNLRGDRKKLADLWERLRAAPSAALVEANRPSKPEDLFKGLDALLEKAAAAEAASILAGEDNASALGDESGAPSNPLARPGEDLPSPEELFRGLQGKSRKNSHD